MGSGVCVFIYVCMHACMHACVYMSVYVCVFACMHACMCLYVCICVCICVLSCLRVECRRLYVGVCVCTNTCARSKRRCMYFLSCVFLTWGASADACSSRAQEPFPVRQRDQRTAVGRVRPAHIAWVSARPRKRSASPLAPPRAPLFGFHCLLLSRLLWTELGQACACLYTFACMHACMPVFI